MDDEVHPVRETIISADTTPEFAFNMLANLEAECWKMMSPAVSQIGLGLDGTWAITFIE